MDLRRLARPGLAALPVRRSGECTAPRTNRQVAVLPVLRRGEPDRLFKSGGDVSGSGRFGKSRGQRRSGTPRATAIPADAAKKPCRDKPAIDAPPLCLQWAALQQSAGDATATRWDLDHSSAAHPMADHIIAQTYPTTSSPLIGSTITSMAPLG